MSYLINLNCHFEVRSAVKGLPWWLSYKESTCNSGHAGEAGSIPGSGRSGGGNGNPLQYSCLGRGAWQAAVHGVTKESDRT